MLLHFKGDYLLINANAIVNALYCINCTSTTDNLTNKPHCAEESPDDLDKNH